MLSKSKSIIMNYCYCYYAIVIYVSFCQRLKNVQNINLFVDSFSLCKSSLVPNHNKFIRQFSQQIGSKKVHNVGSTISSQQNHPSYHYNSIQGIRLSSSAGGALKSYIDECFNMEIDLLSTPHDEDNDNSESNSEYRIFKGKNKWLGGAIDPKDGSIYGIPSNANDIICLRPLCPKESKMTLSEKVQYTIHTISLPHNIRKGKFKWLRGIISNDCLYGIPAWSNDGVLKLDIQKWKNYEEYISNNEDHHLDNNIDDIVSIIPLPESFYNQDKEKRPSRWLWHGAALNANKTAIYCIPSNAHQVLKVDLEESTCSFLPIPETTSSSSSSTPLDQTNKWYGGILGNDNAIYGIPYSAANVLRIDANTDTVSLLGDYGINEYNWHGGVKSEINGCIYCFPAHHSHVLKIDTNSIFDVSFDDESSKNSRLSLVPIQRADYDKDEVTRYKWLGGSLGLDGNIYGMPSDASSILRIDTMKNVATTFGIVSSEKNKWQGGILSDDGNIYAIPSNAKHILRIDTSPASSLNTRESSVSNEREYSLVGDLPGTKDKWQGGFVGVDGLIYCIPENFDKVMKVMPNEDADKVGISFL